MEIRINDKVDLITLSNSYIGGLIKLNVSKLAKDLGTSRNTVSKYLNGFVLSKIKKVKKMPYSFIQGKKMKSILDIGTRQ